MNNDALCQFMDELEDLLRKHNASIIPSFDPSRDLHVLEIDVQIEDGIYVSTTRSVL